MTRLRPLLRRVRDKARSVTGELAWSARKRRVARRAEHVTPLPPPETLRGATVFFVPYAGVTAMFAQASVVARTLHERGHRVLMARCFRLFDRCPVMDMRFDPYEGGQEAKLETCLRCADNSASMRDAYGLEALDLRSLVTPEMVARLDRALAGAPPDLLDFEFEGIPFGLLCAADVVLLRKICDLGTFSDDDRLAWRQYLRSSLLSYLIIDRLCVEFSIGRVVHANDYSLLLGAKVAARKNGVPCYTLSFPGHRNIDTSRYQILPNVWGPYSFKLLDEWPACRDLSLDPERVGDIGDDQLIRLGGRGSHLYSPARTVEQGDLRRALGLSTDRRLLVAYTSSLDESMAGRAILQALDLPIPSGAQPFPDQIHWLQALVAYVEQSSDLQLVVRVHPRESANKRESAVSQHLGKLRAAFGGAYRHCRFVWPQDPVSSYDLGELADVVLTSWSTIGVEMARLGVPVMAAFSGGEVAVMNDDFHFWAPTADEYFEALRMLLERPVSIDRLIRAFRWYSLRTLATTVDLTDVVPRSDFGGLPEFRSPKEAGTLERIIIEGQDVCRLNIERLKSAQHADSAALESQAVARQLRRFVHLLMTGVDPETDLPLSVSRRVGADCERCGRGQVAAAALLPEAVAHRSGVSGASERFLAIDGFHVTYRDGECSFERYSPMVARLGLLCVQAAARAGESVRRT